MRSFHRGYGLFLAILCLQCPPDGLAVKFAVKNPSAGMVFMTGSQIPVIWRLHDVELPYQGVFLDCSCPMESWSECVELRAGIERCQSSGPGRDLICQTIIANTDNNGYYEWTIPSYFLPTSDGFQIRLSAVEVNGLPMLSHRSGCGGLFYIAEKPSNPSFQVELYGIADKLSLQFTVDTNKDLTTQYNAKVYYPGQRVTVTWRPLSYPIFLPYGIYVDVRDYKDEEAVLTIARNHSVALNGEGSLRWTIPDNLVHPGTDLRFDGYVISVAPRCPFLLITSSAIYVWGFDENKKKVAFGHSERFLVDFVDSVPRKPLQFTWMQDIRSHSLLVLRMRREFLDENSRTEIQVRQTWISIFLVNREDKKVLDIFDRKEIKEEAWVGGICILTWNTPESIPNPVSKTDQDNVLRPSVRLLEPEYRLVYQARYRLRKPDQFRDIGGSSDFFSFVRLPSA